MEAVQNGNWIASIEHEARESAKILANELSSESNLHVPSNQDLLDDVVSGCPHLILEYLEKENARPDFDSAKKVVRQYQDHIFENDLNCTDIILRKLRFIDSYDCIERYPVRGYSDVT